MKKTKTKTEAAPTSPSVFQVLGPYRKLIIILILLTIASNGLTLWLPKIIAESIDAYAKQTLVISDVVWLFGGISLGIFALTYGLSIIQTITSERVARDIRDQLADKLSRQSYSYIQNNDPSKLLTNLTSDMDSIKLFVAQAVVSLVTSIVLIVGAGILLVSIDWRLGLAMLAIIPLIGITFFLTLRSVRELFLGSRVVIDKLNHVINESILGAALVRVIDVRLLENKKFKKANKASYDVGLKIIRIFSMLIPIITLLASSATLVILLLGGHFVIDQSLSLGDFAAFNSYLAILIFPILVLGFISNIIAQANASYGRIAAVLDGPIPESGGKLTQTIKGDITVSDLALSFGDKVILKDISFSVKPGSRVAIIGPTAAGKSQLLYMLIGLTQPTSGSIFVDGEPIETYNKDSLHAQMGFVFQDSIIFNLSLRENIAFNPKTTDDQLRRAIKTAELSDLVDSLPDGLDTVISERGTNLSGGQKQRLMLARALALNPKVLLLDDFTARVDAVTEAKILKNVRTHYPNLTLISVTQKVRALKDYDQIILLMQGELLAKGTHTDLLTSSPEYMQIYNSQRSTTEYELQA